MVAQQTYEPKAFYATLFVNNVGRSGLALRTADGRVYFRSETTGLWCELFDSDRPNLHLHGLQPMVDAAEIAQRDYVRHTSRTLQAA